MMDAGDILIEDATEITIFSAQRIWADAVADTLRSIVDCSKCRFTAKVTDSLDELARTFRGAILLVVSSVHPSSMIAADRALSTVLLRRACRPAFIIVNVHLLGNPRVHRILWTQQSVPLTCARLEKYLSVAANERQRAIDGTSASSTIDEDDGDDEQKAAASEDASSPLTLRMTKIHPQQQQQPGDAEGRSNAHQLKVPAAFVMHLRNTPVQVSEKSETYATLLTHYAALQRYMFASSFDSSEQNATSKRGIVESAGGDDGERNTLPKVWKRLQDEGEAYFSKSSFISEWGAVVVPARAPNNAANAEAIPTSDEAAPKETLAARQMVIFVHRPTRKSQHSIPRCFLNHGVVSGDHSHDDDDDGSSALPASRRWSEVVTRSDALRAKKPFIASKGLQLAQQRRKNDQASGVDPLVEADFALEQEMARKRMYLKELRATVDQLATRRQQFELEKIHRREDIVRLRAALRELSVAVTQERRDADAHDDVQNDTLTREHQRLNALHEAWASYQDTLRQVSELPTLCEEATKGYVAQWERNKVVRKELNEWESKVDATTKQVDRAKILFQTLMDRESSIHDAAEKKLRELSKMRQELETLGQEVGTLRVLLDRTAVKGAENHEMVAGWLWQLHVDDEATRRARAAARDALLQTFEEVFSLSDEARTRLRDSELIGLVSEQSANDSEPQSIEDVEFTCRASLVYEEAMDMISVMSDHLRNMASLVDFTERQIALKREHLRAA